VTTGAAWAWTFLDSAGTVLDQPISPAFGNRFDAELWLGEHWRHLAEQGVASVRLLNHGQAAAADLPLRVR
jgi:hypothetical protein